MMSFGAAAQDYPNRNIQIIVPFPPGGIIDAAARLIQPELEAADGNSGHLGAPDQARSAQLRRLIGA